MTGPRLTDDELRRRAAANNALDLVNPNRGDQPVTDQFDAYLNERRKFLAQTMQDVLNAQQTMFPPPQDFSDVNAQHSSSTDALIRPDAMAPTDYADLQGQAKALGIPNADKIPQEALQQIVDIHRRALHPEEKQKLGILAAIIPTAEGLGIGVEKAASDMRQQLRNVAPAFMKDLISEQQSISDNRAKIAESAERIRMNLNSEDQQYFDAQQGIGKVVLQGAAFTGAAELLGGFMGATPGLMKLGPTARSTLALTGAALGSVSGTGTTWLPSADDLQKGFQGDLTDPETLKAIGRVVSDNKAGVVAATVAGSWIANKLNAKFRPGQFEAENPSTPNNSVYGDTPSLPGGSSDGSSNPFAGWGKSKKYRNPFGGGVDPYEGIPYADFEEVPAGQKLLGGSSGAQSADPLAADFSVESPAGPTSPTPEAIKVLEETHLRQVTPDQVVTPPTGDIAPIADATSPSAAITPDEPMVRLYRGQDATTKIGSPYNNGKDLTHLNGRWWTTDLREAQRYTAGPNYETVYTDVPQSEVSNYLAMKHPDGPGNVGSPSTEHILPPQYVARQKPFVWGETPEVGMGRSLMPVKPVTAPEISTITDYSGPRQIQGPVGPLNTASYAAAQLSGNLKDIYTEKRLGSLVTSPADAMPEILRLKALQTEADISRMLHTDEANNVSRILIEQLQAKNQGLQNYSGQQNEEQLRSQIVDLKAKAMDHSVRIKEIDSQINDLMDRSGITQLPKAWQVWKANPMSPVTPSAQWVIERGVHPTFATPDGKPIVMLQGTGRVYDYIDPNTLNTPGNFRGPGTYSSNSVEVTGGDPFNPLTPAISKDYAWVRARTLQSDVKSLVAQKNLFEQYLQTGQTPEGPLDPQTIPQYQAALADIGSKIADFADTVAPNVRMHFLAGTEVLDGRKTFDLTQPADQETMLRIMKSGSETYPTLDWNKWADQVKQGKLPPPVDDIAEQMANSQMIPYEDAIPQLTWDHVYQSLINEEVPRPENLSSNSTMGPIPTIGKDGVNQIVQNAGYQHYIYEGGANQGTHSHMAVVTFDPANVVPVFMDQLHTAEFAEHYGIAYNNKEIIQAAPNAADLTGRGTIGDREVIEAQVASQPGSFNLLRGIEDPAKLMKDLVELKKDGTIRSFRVVEHNGRLDLLTSSFGEITDKQVSLYKEHGIFYGQEGVSPTGKEGRIVGYTLNEKGKIAFKTVNQTGNRKQFYLPEVIKPGLRSSGSSVLEVPPMYEAFKKFALADVEDRLHSAGMVGYKADWFDDEVSKRLQSLFNDFVNKSSIKEKGAQVALQRYFDLRRIDDVKALAPEEFARLDMIRAERDEAVARALDEGRFQNIAALAQLKGFTVTTNTGEPGYVLEDISNTNKIPFLDEGSIRAFLGTQDAIHVPDITPSTSMPAEATEVPSDTFQIEGMNADDYMNSVADEFEKYGRTFGDPTDLYSDEGIGLDFGGGPGGRPPNEPPSDGSGFGDIPFRALPPGQTPSGMARHYTNLFRSKQANIAQIEDMISDFKIRSFMPQRNGMQLIEEKLNAIGYTDPSWRPGKVFSDVAIAFDHARNAAYPVHIAANSQLNQLGSAKLRNGTMWRVFEQHSPVHRIAEGKKAGLSTKEIEAIGTLRAQLEQAVGSERVKQFVDYIGDVRNRHQHNNFGPTSYRATNQPLMKDFAELMQQKNMQLMNLDLSSLVPTFIRAHYFAQEALPVWKEASQTWTKIQNINIDGKRPFFKIGGHVTDWLDYIKTGHQPGFDAGTKLVRNMLRVFLPVSDAQAREVVSQLTMAAYRGQMGLRPYTIIRDTNQVLMAGPYVGWKDLAEATLKAFMKGSNVARQEMLARSIKYGTAQRGIIKTAGVHGFMEDDVTNSGYAQPTDNLTIHQQFQQNNAVRAQNAMDHIRDNMPDALRNIEGTKLDPLYWYGNYNNWGRIVVGEAAYQRFTRAYNVYDAQRKAFLLGNGKEPDIEQFVRDSRVDAHDPSVVRGQIELVKAGRYEEAVMRHMNEVNAESNYIYGNLNKPPGLRSNAAKMGMMYGNYAQGTATLVYNLATRPSSNTRKAEMLALLGGMTVIYEIAQAKTHWNWRNFNPVQSLFSYTGSPMLHALASGVEKLNAVERVALATDQDFVPYSAVQDAKLPSAIDFLAGAASAVNPAGGLVWAGKVARSASQSPDPFGTVAEAFITGGSSDRVQQKNAQMQWLDDRLNGTGAELNPHSVVPQTRLPGPSQFHSLQRDGQHIAGDPLGQLLDNVKQLPPEQQQQIIDKFLMSRGAQGSTAPSGGKGAQ